MSPQSKLTELARVDGSADHRAIHAAHPPAGGVLRAAWDRLFDALVRAPAVPTLFPLPADSLRRCGRLLADEDYPAIELLARPLDELLPTLRAVFAGPERHSVLWGIGTITSREAALRAAELRPDFLVSPAFSRRVLEVAVEAGIPYIPAGLTFQDVQNVLDTFSEFGLPLKVLKLCPVFGIAPEYVQALASCFPGIAFCPTGEITLDNFLQWKRLPGIIAPMGAELLPVNIIEQGQGKFVPQRLRLLRELSDVAAELRDDTARRTRHSAVSAKSTQT